MTIEMSETMERHIKLYLDRLRTVHTSYILNEKRRLSYVTHGTAVHFTRVRD